MREVVSHAPEPLPAPWILEEDLVIGVEYGSEEYMLRNPFAFVVMDGGEIVIYDNQPFQLRVYDGQGRFLRAFGQEGQGPTDLQRFAHLRDVGEGLFQLWGGVRPFRIQTWNLLGEWQDTQTLPEGHPLYLRSIRHWDGDRLWTEIGEYDRSGERAWARTTIVSSTWSGTVLDTFMTHEIRPMMPIGASMAQAMMDDTPYSQFLLTSAGRAYYSRLEEDWVREYEVPGGREILRFHWIHEPDSIPESMAEELSQLGSGRYQDDIVEGVEWLREQVTMFGLGEGPEHEIWVQRNPWNRDLIPYTIDVFSVEGRYRGRLEVPFPANLMQYRDGYLYAIGHVGEAPALIRYRLQVAR